jgi:hydrogenase expression/formation protein HypC
VTSFRAYGDPSPNDYGIHPVTVAGGTLKLKDELKFTFDIVGRRKPESGAHMCLAIPGMIVSLADDPAHSALADVVGVRRRVDISLVEPEGIGPGDWVLIHVGFAMSKIRQQDADEPTRMLTALGEPKPPWRRCAATAPTTRPHPSPRSQRSAPSHEIRR